MWDFELDLFCHASLSYSFLHLLESFKVSTTSFESHLSQNLSQPLENVILIASNVVESLAKKKRTMNVNVLSEIT